MKTRIISKENTTSGCHELFLLKNHTMNEGADHPQLELLVGLLLVDELFLLATVVVDLLMVVVIGLQEVIMAVLPKVAITDI
jgi:hypothetical protein